LKPVTLGVVADTHIPDRTHCLPEKVLAVFQQADVQAILHAGDVSVPNVLAQLASLAPVHAVRGNRDWWRLRHLPASLTLNLHGIKIGLTHGYGDLSLYLGDKLHLLLKGVPRFEVFDRRALRAFTGVQVVVFGHIHHPVNRFVDGVLLFNPGSPCCPIYSHLDPSVGLLHISEGGKL
jgi:hypothetical protein